MSPFSRYILRSLAFLKVYGLGFFWSVYNSTLIDLNLTPELLDVRKVGRKKVMRNLSFLKIENDILLTLYLV